MFAQVKVKHNNTKVTVNCDDIRHFDPTNYRKNKFYNVKLNDGSIEEASIIFVAGKFIIYWKTNPVA